MASSRKHHKKQRPVARAKSEELGTDFAQAPLNSKTGRPMRDGAGKRARNPDYCDSSEVIDDDTPLTSGPEDDEGVKLKPARKRKRTPSPSPPPLSSMPEHPDEVPSREPSPNPFMQDPEDEPEVSPLSLTFNVPAGFAGPFVVNLTASSLQQLQIGQSQRVSGNTNGSLSDSIPSNSKTTQVAPSTPNPEPNLQRQSPLFRLSAEIRAKIFRNLFSTRHPIDFNHPNNFARSSALLRTCKRIYTEGRTILYCDNQFWFQRNCSTRQKYWEELPTEIGFKDVRLFLKTIGTTNISLIRQITWTFDDATPSATPYLTHEHRRFVHDQQLIDCLRIIAQYSNLTKLRLFFRGRKALDRTDFKFLDKLRAVKADEVVILTVPPAVLGVENDGDHLRYQYFRTEKISYALQLSLLEEMVRDKKEHAKKVKEGSLRF